MPVFMAWSGEKVLVASVGASCLRAGPGSVTSEAWRKLALVVVVATCSSELVLHIAAVESALGI